MNSFYIAVFTITELTLISMAVLVYNNGRIPAERKQDFYLSYSAIGVAAICEVLAVALNGAPASTIGLHIIVKCLDYVVTPACSVLFIRQIIPNSRNDKFMRCVLVGNLVLQVISAFTGWTYYVDADNYYYHGPLYAVYVIVAAIAAIFVLTSFAAYGKQFQKQNRASLISIIAVLVVGLVIQEIIDSDVRTDYLAMAIVSTLLFIHYSEYAQMSQDAALTRQQQLLDTDPLTGVLSRFAYKQMAEDAETVGGGLPDGFVALEIDLNGLKAANDGIGHDAGDELIKGAGAVLKETFGTLGKVYRTGGDEFVAILEPGAPDADEAVRMLKENAAKWRGQKVDSLSVAVGYAKASEHPGSGVRELVDLADTMMYDDKERYYRESGRERRQPR